MGTRRPPIGCALGRAAGGASGRLGAFGSEQSAPAQPAWQRQKRATHAPWPEQPRPLRQSEPYFDAPSGSSDGLTASQARPTYPRWQTQLGSPARSPCSGYCSRACSERTAAGTRHVPRWEQEPGQRQLGTGSPPSMFLALLWPTAVREVQAASLAGAMFFRAQRPRSGHWSVRKTMLALAAGKSDVLTSERAVRAPSACSDRRLSSSSDTDSSQQRGVLNRAIEPYLCSHERRHAQDMRPTKVSHAISPSGCSRQAG
mmetsp:Transcript_32884/g.97892  ORF Transcript_32884/g.97892 Transcript_32884/m.97892 type:complete len:258 (+) Transcript_32884:3-776(+)